MNSALAKGPRPTSTQFLADILSKRTVHEHFAIDYIFPMIGRKKHLLHDRHLKQGEPECTSLILLAIEEERSSGRRPDKRSRGGHA